MVNRVFCAGIELYLNHKHVISSILVVTLCIYITFRSRQDVGISRPFFAFVTDANRSSF